MLSGHSGPVFSLLVLHDGRLVSGSEDETLMVWNLALASCLFTLRGHGKGISCLSEGTDGLLLSG